MKKRRGNGPFGHPHSAAIAVPTCQGCKKGKPTYWHRDAGAVCHKCWASFKASAAVRPFPAPCKRLAEYQTVANLTQVVDLENHEYQTALPPVFGCNALS